MSDTFDHECEAWDQAESLMSEGINVFKYTKTCRRCGEDGLCWEETERGWRLFDTNDKMHTCNKP